jgi:hypothetical protein
MSIAAVCNYKKLQKHLSSLLLCKHAALHSSIACVCLCGRRTPRMQPLHIRAKARQQAVCLLPAAHMPYIQSAHSAYSAQHMQPNSSPHGVQPVQQPMLVCSRHTRRNARPHSNNRSSAAHAAAVQDSNVGCSTQLPRDPKKTASNH